MVLKIMNQEYGKTQNPSLYAAKCCPERLQRLFTAVTYNVNAPLIRKTGEVLWSIPLPVGKATPTRVRAENLPGLCGL